MNKIKWLGFILLFAAGLVFGYEVLTWLMRQSGHMVNHSLTMIMGSDSFDWINSLSMHELKTVANYIVTMPFYALLAALGIIFLIISGLFTK